jgi:hypothetical protein
MANLVRAFPSKLTLTIFADAGCFQDLGDRLKKEFPNAKDGVRVDLLTVPATIHKEIQREVPGVLIESPREARILYNLGSASAVSFLEKMQAEWSVQTLPLGMCRYERANGSEGPGIPPFRIRFHAPISYSLGFLAARLGEPKADAPRRDHMIVAVVSDDPQVIPSLADARQCGLDARLVWFTGALSAEVAHFAARNGVPIVFIDPTMVSDSHQSTGMRSRESANTYLNGILGISNSRR